MAVAEVAPVIPPPVRAPDLETYHSEQGRWSSSRLRMFRQSRSLAKQVFIDGDAPDNRDTVSQIVGTAAHAIILDPGTGQAPFIEVPVDSRAAKGFKVIKEAVVELVTAKNLVVMEGVGRQHKAFKDAIKEHPGRVVVTIEEAELAAAAAENPRVQVLTRPMAETARRIAHSILEPRTEFAELAKALLTAPGGYPEYSLEWEDPAGVPCKGMVDYVVPVWGSPTVVDLKTTAEPGPEFYWHAKRYEYDAQGRFNLRAMRQALGMDAAFCWVTVRNEAPFEVGVWQMSEEQIERGEKMVEDSLRDLGRCLGGELQWCEWWEMGDQIPKLERPERA